MKSFLNLTFITELRLRLASLVALANKRHSRVNSAEPYIVRSFIPFPERRQLRQNVCVAHKKKSKRTM
jgi:hypothetical protein